jgi:hypothetical protein
MPYKKHQNALPSKGQFHGVIENLRIVDGMVWAGIRGEPSVLSPRLRDELMTVAMQRFPGDPNAIYPWVNEQVQKLMHPPGDAWDALFLTDPHDVKADVLLKHPVERAWVISTQVFTRSGTRV